MAMTAVIITFNKAKPGFLHTGREREYSLVMHQLKCIELHINWCITFGWKWVYVNELKWTEMGFHVPLNGQAGHI